MNLFERAARGKWRFPSSKGDLTAEQLFDLPLTGNKGFNLDAIAMAINTDLQGRGNRSFVQSNDGNDAETSALRGKLELVVDVIDSKQRQAAINQDRAARESEAARIEQALERRKDADLEGLSAAELEAKLASLRA